MKITPEISIEQKVIKQKEIKELSFNKTSSPRKNNRKSNRGRHTQTIVCMVNSWPPVFKTKVIKHLTNHH